MAADGPHIWDQFTLLLRARRFNEARELAMRAVRLEPESASGYAMMSTVTRLSGELAESRRFARLAIERAPDWSFPYSCLAWAIVADQKYQPLDERGRPIGNSAEARLREAHRLALVALEIEADDAANYHLLGLCLNFEEKHGEALTAAENGLRFDPSHGGCRNEQLRALFALGRLEDVEARAKEAIADDPENDEFHHWLATAYVFSGRHDLALPHAREAVRLNPTDADYQATFLRSLAAEPLLSRWTIRVFYAVQRYVRLIVQPPQCWIYWLLGIIFLLLAIWCGKSKPNSLMEAVLSVIAVWWLILLPLFCILLARITEPTIELLLTAHRDSRRYLSRWEIFGKIALPAYYVLMAAAIGITMHADKQAGKSEVSGWPIAAVWVSVFSVWACSRLNTVRSKAVGYLIGSAQLFAIASTGLIALVTRAPGVLSPVGIASAAATAIVCAACVVVYLNRPTL
jgi:tetratricopeptide (TPR) repeat protein